MGLRYRAMLPPSQLLETGSSLSRIVSDFTTSVSLLDLGSIRAGNDGTFDSRARHFVAWINLEQIIWADSLAAI